MANVKFNLKDPKAKGPTLIYLIFRFHGKRLKYSTGEKINPKYWNFKNNRSKQTRQFSGYDELNGYLDGLENTVLKSYRKSLSEEKRPTLESLKSSLDIFTYREEKSSPTSLFPFIIQFIEERERNSKYTKSSILVYKTAFNRLVQYSKDKRKKLDFENIDLEFFYDYSEYLFASPRLFSQNYVNKLIQTLKTFLNDATERGINTNMSFKSRRFSIPKQSVQNIYLSMDELFQMYHHDFEENYRLARVKDLFLIGAFTGLRFSDFINIKPENIQNIEGAEIIRIRTKKTNQDVVIPVHPIVRKILNKYKGSLPRFLSNQKMNAYLKEVGFIVGFHEPIILSKSKGGQRYDITKRKYELITTHTARRSFATNAFKMGVPTISIMRITGHTTERSFMQYIKVSNEENALLMAKNQFFNGRDLLKIVS